MSKKNRLAPAAPPRQYIQALDIWARGAGGALPTSPERGDGIARDRLAPERDVQWPPGRGDRPVKASLAGQQNRGSSGQQTADPRRVLTRRAADALLAGSPKPIIRGFSSHGRSLLRPSVIEVGPPFSVNVARCVSQRFTPMAGPSAAFPGPGAVAGAVFERVAAE